MLAHLRPIVLVVALATSASVPNLARGQDSPRSSAGGSRATEATRSDVIDDGGMFSPEAITKAKQTLGRIDRAYKVTVTVDTVESLQGQDVEEVAIRRAEQLNHKGIFILIARRDRKAETLASPKALRDELTRTRLHGIRDAFTAEFRKGEVDEGLIKGVLAAEAALAATRPDTAREVAVTEGGSSGGTSALVLRGQVRLTSMGARRIIMGAEAKAVELKIKSILSVVDDAGLLLAFERMDGARPAAIGTSQIKATSAATNRAATGQVSETAGKDKIADVFLNFGLQAAATESGAKFTSLPGGLPIMVDGQVIGAIGVAGGSGEQDLEVAKAGVAAFIAGLGESSGEAKPKPNPTGDSSGAKADEIKPRANETVEPMPR